MVRAIVVTLMPSIVVMSSGSSRRVRPFGTNTVCPTA